MINNRQGGGRRRGRGGQRGQNVGGGQPGNRQDNRQRGNAAQLLEKYKSMARDAQLSGDRVQTEYYLQYADHYFRVLGENRPRFEEQRRARGDELEDEDGEEEQLEASDQEGSDEDERPQRAERPERSDRYEQRPQRERPRRGSADDDQERAPRETGNRVNGASETMPFDALPPAIGLDDSPEEAPEAEARPVRRRTRAPRSDDGDIAPAA